MKKRTVLTLAIVIMMLATVAQTFATGNDVFSANTPEAREAVTMSVQDVIDSRVTTNGLSPEGQIVFELEVFRLTNIERANNNLPLLVWNDALAADARQHSVNMATAGRLYHGRLWANAENAAYGQRTPEAVVQSWMGSPGHRANILHRDLRSIGIGVATSLHPHSTVSHGIYWTQNFSTSTDGIAQADLLANVGTATPATPATPAETAPTAPATTAPTAPATTVTAPNAPVQPAANGSLRIVNDGGVRAASGTITFTTFANNSTNGIRSFANGNGIATQMRRGGANATVQVQGANLMVTDRNTGVTHTLAPGQSVTLTW